MNLPKPQIDRETAMNLWIAERSDYAKEQVILNNTGIIGLVLKKMNLSTFDEDLFATGLVGLVKAINGFDAERGNKFNTYASSSVRNEISMLFRKDRIVPSFSLDEPCNLGDGDKVSYADSIPDDFCLEDEVMANIQFDEMMNFLSEREKRIISLRMKGKTQQQIADIFGISRSRAQKIIKSIYEKYKAEFC